MRSAYTADVLEIIGRRSDVVRSLVDNLDDGPLPYRGQVTIALVDVMPGADGIDVVVPLITPGFRFLAVAAARKLGSTRFPALIDPTAVVASTAVVREGVVINAGVVVGAAAEIGSFVSVNRSASVGHDCVVEPYATLGPGVVLAGSVRVGHGAFIGAGATVMPEISIGANAIVGAGAVVTRDVPSGATVVGNPGRVIAQDGSGFQGVSVPGV